MGFCFGWWKIVSFDLFVGFNGGSHLGWDRVDLGFEGFVGEREREREREREDHWLLWFFCYCVGFNLFGWLLCHRLFKDELNGWLLCHRLFWWKCLWVLNRSGNFIFPWEKKEQTCVGGCRRWDGLGNKGFRWWDDGTWVVGWQWWVVANASGGSELWMWSFRWEWF